MLLRPPPVAFPNCAKELLVAKRKIIRVVYLTIEGGKDKLLLLKNDKFTDVVLYVR